RRPPRRSRRRRPRTDATPAASGPRAAWSTRSPPPAPPSWPAPRASGGLSSFPRALPGHRDRIEHLRDLLFGEDALLANQLHDAAASFHRLGCELGRTVVADHRIEGGHCADAVLDVMAADVLVGGDPVDAVHAQS